MLVCHVTVESVYCSALLLQIGFVASFTSKLSDTVSSEIGKVRLYSVHLSVVAF
jgi:uncharacterized membrane protein